MKPLIDDTTSPPARSLKQDFPIFKQTFYGKPLTFLDSAATSQKPQAVIDRISRYYSAENANIHRGVYKLSEIATSAYESARREVAGFLNAPSENEIIFTSGTTDGINLVATAFERGMVQTGDEIIISGMEHHSNIVPWQILCEQTGAKLRVIPLDEQGDLRMDAYASLLNKRTRLVAVVAISNSLGTVNPIEKIISMAHEIDVPVLIDGAQLAPHAQIDVQALDCDFLTLSGHKVFGPTGTGVLYGKAAWLDRMPPYRGGGDMIETVTFEKTTYNTIPHKFEAGTPNIAGVVGLAAALQYVQNVGYDVLARHERSLLDYGTKALTAIPGLRLIGTAKQKAGVLSFVMDDIHPHDIGTILDREGIAVRTGHHCTQPVMAHFNVPATTRASFALYNETADFDRLAEGLEKVRQIFS